MKRALLVALLLLPSLARPQPAPETREQRDARMKWWREARFGMFIHWGLYAIPGGEWNGKPVKGIGEWIMQNGAIPVADYEKLKDQFNPVKFDARTWVRLAGDAGMKYIVITSKHHDGFCLWDSKVSQYTVANSPFKRDILKELSDACKADGRVRFCVYHSIMDWHHPDAQSINQPGSYNTGKGYKPNENFPRYVKEYLKPQLKELITQYDVGVLWFDGEWIPEYTEAMGHEVYSYCKSLNPNIIINNRVGKSRKGMSGMSESKESAGDFGTPEQEIPATGIPGADWESCMTMNDTWGFKKDDRNWKSTKTLLQNLVDIASKGGNYLLNVGPTAEGEIPAESVQRLIDIGDWMNRNAASIHNTQASPFKRLPFGRATTAGDKLYLHVFNYPKDGNLVVPPIAGTVKSAALLAGGAAVQFKQEESGITLTLPQFAPDPIDAVVVLTVAGPITPTAAAIRQGEDGALTLLAIDADVQGTKAKVEKKGNNPHNIGYWTSDKDIAVWQASITQAGKFTVDLEYSLAPNSKGSEIAVEFGDQKLPVKLKEGKDFLDFRTERIGEVTLPAGPVKVTVRPTAKPGLAVMDLRQIVLKPAQ